MARLFGEDISEVLFSPTGECNLKCIHCIVKRRKRILPINEAIRFLHKCKKAGIERVGFTGGEPFLAGDFLCALTRKAVKAGMFFDRIMTNGVWYEDKASLSNTLSSLCEAGYDGTICVSVDDFHRQKMEKVAHFISTAWSIWGRKDIISIARVTGYGDDKTRNGLKKLAGLLGARLISAGRYACIKKEDIFINILNIELSMVSAPLKSKNGWNGKWFREDYCKGPAGVFHVMPDGSVKPCCGYAADSDALTIGNIKKDSVGRLVKKAEQNRFVSAVLNTGLSKIRHRMESLGVRFPGKTSNHCFFCHYVLTRIPRAILAKCLSALILLTVLSSPVLPYPSNAYSSQNDQAKLCKAEKFRSIITRVRKKIEIPAGYHEGLFYDGKDLWLCNGKNLKTWIIGTGKGDIVSELNGIGTFTEAVARDNDGRLFSTDWDEKKVYLTKVANGKMIAESEVSVAPSHPTGIVWDGTRLLMILWTRGMGTKFDIIEMDTALNVTGKVSVDLLVEPAHLAWDGKNLWITSWFSRIVYMVDTKKWELLGSFASPVSRPTGIAWDGRFLWLTGTYGDLYQVEIRR